MLVSGLCKLMHVHTHMCKNSFWRDMHTHIGRTKKRQRAWFERLATLLGEQICAVATRGTANGCADSAGVTVRALLMCVCGQYLYEAAHKAELVHYKPYSNELAHVGVHVVPCVAAPRMFCNKAMQGDSPLGEREHRVLTLCR